MPDVAGDVRIVTLDEVRRAVDLPTAIRFTARALVDAAPGSGAVVTSTIAHLDLPPSGELHVKGASVLGAPIFAVKMATGFPGNAARGLPATGGFTAVFGAEGGQLLALLLDGGYLTDLRTAAAGAVAVDALSAPDLADVVVVGTGTQARLQLAAAREVRPDARVTIVGRRPEAVDAALGWAAERGIVGVRGSMNLADAVRCADAVITATYSRRPLIELEHLRPHAHVTAVGADAPGKREVGVEVLGAAALVVVDSLDQSRSRGELQGVDERTLSGPPLTLGEFLRSGARRPDGITVADLTGLGVEDLAMAEAVLGRLDLID